MRAERLLGLVALLQRRPRTTAAELAAELKVSIRTIRRDIESLSSLGVPIYTDVGRGGGIRLLPGYSAAAQSFTDLDVESLALLGGPKDGLSGSDTGSVLQKLVAAAPQRRVEAIQHARNRLLFDTDAWFSSDNEPLPLQALKTAVWEDREIGIWYQRLDGRVRQYRLRPLALVAKVELWYLVAALADAGARPEADQLRVFRVSRVLHLQQTPHGFQRDPEFDLRRFWREWTRRFERSPPDRYLLQVELTAVGMRRLVALEGRRIGRQLEGVAPPEVGAAAVEIDFETERRALSLVVELGFEVRVLGPTQFRDRLRLAAETVVRQLV